MSCSVRVVARPKVARYNRSRHDAVYLRYFLTSTTNHPAESR